MASPELQSVVRRGRGTQIPSWRSSRDSLRWKGTCDEGAEDPLENRSGNTTPGWHAPGAKGSSSRFPGERIPWHSSTACIGSPGLSLTLAVAHLNHRLRGEESDQDENCVREICAQLCIPFFSESADVGERAASARQNLEEAAREVRYDFLRRTAVRDSRAENRPGPYPRRSGRDRSHALSARQRKQGPLRHPSGGGGLADPAALWNADAATSWNI